MEKYIVIALSCFSGKNNKIYNSQDEVDETCFPDGQIPELVQQGFLKKKEGTETVAEVIPPAEPEVPTLVNTKTEPTALTPPADNATENKDTEPATETLLEKAKKNVKK